MSNYPDEEKIGGLVTGCIVLIATIILVVLIYASSWLVGEIRNETVEINQLQKFNQDKGKELLTTNYWSHDNLDCNYQCIVDRAELEGKVAENLYWGTCDIDLATNAWKGSPSHNKVLGLDYDEMYIGTYYTSDTECYIILNKLKY